MAQDKLSKNWRENQTTHETYSAFDDLSIEELRDTAQAQWDNKIKDSFEYDGYYFVPSIFPQKDKENKPVNDKDGKPVLVKLLYRYMDKNDEGLKKRVERIGESGSGGSRNYAPKKEYTTFVLAIEWIENGDVESENAALADGKIPLTVGDLPEEMLMFKRVEENKKTKNPEELIIRAWGNKYKYELKERS